MEAQITGSELPMALQNDGIAREGARPRDREIAVAFLQRRTQAPVRIALLLRDLRA